MDDRNLDDERSLNHHRLRNRHFDRMDDRNLDRDRDLDSLNYQLLIGTSQCTQHGRQRQYRDENPAPDCWLLT